MKPVDLQTMVELVKMPGAPVMLCQAGFIFVNDSNLSMHPQIQSQLTKRLENDILQEVQHYPEYGVSVYCITHKPVPAKQPKAQEKAKLFKLKVEP